jgi:hypothetical protein
MRTMLKACLVVLVALSVSCVNAKPVVGSKQDADNLVVVRYPDAGVVANQSIDAQALSRDVGGKGIKDAGRGVKSIKDAGKAHAPKKSDHVDAGKK